MTFDSNKPTPNVTGQKYNLTDDAVTAVKTLVHSEVSRLIRNISLDEVVFKKYQEQLDKYMMKQYPDLSNRLNSLALLLDEKIKSIDKICKNLKDREKKVVTSETLYEDVYKMRDEMKSVMNFMETFQKKIKKVFE